MAKQLSHGARRFRRIASITAIAAAVFTVGLLIPAPAAPTGSRPQVTTADVLEAASLPPSAPSAQSDWPTYLGNLERTSASDARIGPIVSPAWTHVVSGFIASEPVIVNNRVYVTAWDGYLYALDEFDGHEIWRKFLGTYQIRRFTTPSCGYNAGFNMGITGAPAYDPGTQLLYINAMSATVVMTNDQSYLSDTGPYLYALETVSGTIQWQQLLSANPDNYAWSSPLIANDRAYVGVASQGDCPLTQGQLVAVGLTGTHTVQRAVMAPDSLTFYAAQPLTKLPDESDWNYTATAAIEFRGPQSAAVSIRLRHAQNGTSYQPQLFRRDEGNCDGLLTFVQNFDDPKLADSSGVLDFTRDIALDTAVLNDGKHFLVVPGLVPCVRFELGTGGGIWSSPTYDAVLHRVYVTTGTPTPPCVPQTSCTFAQSTLGPRTAAVVALDADTLGIAWSWQVPFKDQSPDSDFGATPALCTADSNQRMLGVANKNGIFYGFDTQMPGSPWTKTIAIGGGSPEQGQGSLSSAACAGGVFYVGAGMPKDASVCASSEVTATGQVWALYAAAGAPRWPAPHCTSLVMGPVTAAGGMVMYGTNCRSLGCPRRIEMLDQASGALRYRGTPQQLAGLGDMVSGIAVVDGLMVSGDSLPPPDVTGTARYYPLTGTVRALRAWAGLYLPFVTR